jgi:hypothetical protein
VKRDDATNPFEEYGLDPREGPQGITERLRELIEDATTDEERARIRAAWEELTINKDRRLRAALLAHPETRPALGAAPPLPRAAGDALGARDLELADLVGVPALAPALGLPKSDSAAFEAEASLASDPVLSTEPSASR